MSKQIDERVVEMRFDNKDFEANVKTSLGTIDKLKAALRFEGATKGMSDISAAAKNVDLSAMGKSADAVSVRFSALQTVAMTAISNITSSAMGMAKNLVSQFTIDPISAGFREYETQLNAVQTILANTQSKGTTINQVNDALDELNNYADQTIYNFGEMTQNIGRFTSAGVDLDKAVKAIQGIANLGAMSGSTSAQVSSAMYQLSQALAAGRVSLMDWNSVVNAGMGGEQFQNALKRTAENFGYDVDAMIEKYGSFRESLTQGGWLTAEVLTETLNQLSGAYTEADLIAQGYTEDQAKDIMQMARTAEEAATKVKTFTQLMQTLNEAAGSGWAQSFRTILGDFEEARSFFTDLSEYLGDMIGAQSDTRNALLSGAFDSGWQKISSAVTDAGVSLDAFQNKLSEVASEHGIDLSKMIEDQGSLAAVMESGAVSSDVLVQTLRRLSDEAGNVDQRTQQMTAKFDAFKAVVENAWSSYDTEAARINALANAGYEYAEVSELATQVVNGQITSIDQLSQAQLESIGYTEDQTLTLAELAKAAETSGSSIDELIKSLDKPSGRELFLDSLFNIVQAFFEPLKALRQAFHEVFGMSSEDLYAIIEGFHRFTEILVMSEETANNLKNTFKGVLSVFKIFTTLFGGAFGLIFNVLLGFLENFQPNQILAVTGAIGEMITNFVDAALSGEMLFAALGKLRDILGVVTQPIRDFFSGFGEIEAVKNAGEAIKNFFDPLFSYIDQLRNMNPADAINKIVTDFKNVFANMSWEGFLTGVGNIRAKIENVFWQIVQAAQTVGPDIIAGLQNGLSSGVDKVFQTMADIGTKILEAIKAVLGINSPSTEMFEVGQNIIQGLINGLETLVGAVIGFFQDLGNKISTTFSGIDWGTIAVSALAVGGFVGLLKILGKFADAIQIFSKPAESLGDLLQSVGSAVDTFSDKMKASIFEMRTEAILNVAKAIALLAASLVVMTMVDTEKLYASIGAIALLAGILTAVTVVITKFADLEGIRESVSLSGFITSLGITLALMAAALKIASTIDPAQLEPAMAAMQGMVVMAALMGAVAVAGGEKIQKSGKVFRQIGLSFVLLAVSMKIMGTIDEGAFNNASNVLGAIVSMIGVMVLVGTVAGNRIDGLGSTILKISVAMGILAALAYILSGIDPAQFDKGLTAILKLEVLVAGLVLVTRLIGGKDAGKIGASLLAVSAAIAIMAFVAVQLSKVDPESLAQGVTFVAGFAVIIIALMAVSKMIAGKQSVALGVNLLAISAAIGIMAGIAVLLGYVDPAKFWKGYACVAALSALVAGLMYVSKYTTSSQGTVIAMAATIAVLVAGLVILANLDTARVIVAVGAISVVMGMLAVVFLASKNTSKNMGTAIAMAATLAVVVAGLAILAQFDPNSVLASAESLSLVIGVLSAAMLVMSKINTVSGAALVAMASMVAVMAMVAIVLGALEALNIELSLESAASLSLVLATFAGITAILSVIGVGAGAAVAGAVGMVAVIGIISAAVLALGGVFELFPQLEPLLDTAIRVSGKIGQAIGAFVGGILGGLIEGAMDAITNTLPMLGAKLSEFMANIQPFVTGAQALAGVDFSGVSNLVLAILEIAAAQFIQGVLDFLGAGLDFEKFKTDLEALADGMVSFSDKVKNIDNSSVTAAGIAMQGIAALMSQMATEGGIMSFIMGDKESLGDFAEQLPLLGTAIAAFCTSVTGIDTSGVGPAVEAGKQIAALAGELQNYGGLAGAIFGDKETLGEFSEGLTQFGTAIVDFCAAVTGIDTSGVDSAVDAGTKIAGMADGLPQDSGWWGSVFGGNTDLGTFSEQLTTFADAIAGFAERVQGIDFSNVNIAVNYTRTLVNLLKNNKDAKQDIVSGAEAIKGIPSVGYSLQQFTNYISGLDLANIGTAVTSIQQLVDLVKGMDGITSDGAIAFQTAISAITETTIGSLTSAFAGVIGQMTSIGISMMQSLSVGVMMGVASVIPAAQTVANAALNTFPSFYGRFNGEGIQLVGKLGGGMDSARSVLTTVASGLLSDAVSALNGYYDSFYSAGSYLVKGLASGIRNNSSIAASAARTVASRAIAAAKAEMKEASPSKVGIQIGRFFSQGIGIGIERDGAMVEATSREVGKSAIDSMRNAIAGISSVMESDIDINPTITPVVDLANVKSGSSQINSMLGNLVSGATLGNVKVVGGLVDARNQNGAMDEVVKAIKHMDGRLDSIGKPTYNVNGITYDDGSNISAAVSDLVHAVKMERRI